jgi:hypothetical protein
MNFQLPPPWSSSSSPDTSSKSNSPKPSPVDVAAPVIQFHVPPPWSSSGYSNSESEYGTPIASNRTLSETVRAVGGFDLLPINCTVLSYKKGASGTLIQSSILTSSFTKMDEISDVDFLQQYEASDPKSTPEKVHPIPAVHGEVPAEADCINPDSIDLAAMAKAMVDERYDAYLSEGDVVNNEQYCKY